MKRMTSAKENELKQLEQTQFLLADAGERRGTDADDACDASWRRRHALDDRKFVERRHGLMARIE
jgi:hypothetical protein